MEIYVVKQGDTIESIAIANEIAPELLIRDNELDISEKLVVGQCLVITKPLETYIVQPGDTLLSIAESHNSTLLTLYRNNPFLADRDYIYPGEILVIRYNNTLGLLTIHGNVFPYVNRNILRKTLPYLTYLSIINYTVTNSGEIISYADETELIMQIKEYGVKPLMLLTTLTIQGKANIGIAYDILLNEDFQDIMIDNVISILSSKGYYGLNISLEYINESTLKAYEGYLSNIFRRLHQSGFYVFVTLSPGISFINNQIKVESLNYTVINQLAHNLIFMSSEWSTNINPPSPITSIDNIKLFLDYVKTIMTPNKVIIGIPTLGYDWQLPFVAGISEVRLLNSKTAIDLARVVDADIQFDTESFTPYFTYSLPANYEELQHIVWFIDVRTINALLGLAIDYQLKGTGIWNIMTYNPHLWLSINTQYEIAKIIEEVT